ncbi:hypothetical protein C488_01844 [Natrinema pellirubrum DSM 15624]|uniref:DUF488 domain-containing protein n=1 Tax=Natrinema pellirubrum (strain DSM 15624 / CIP 106293 / JCM 10476 / NCIMB 786 / 157) TaxID=797303 RepID=L0JL85_NATP1|nr:DUF488 domain-containing protein [Natrinema pellirubrum]AGB31126.1 Protein of unknown function, DUF488 [Natrinema pellirubrum DSM 15624]ELY81223.1 hypothetical protein C488_01844 [Natrinema pellirubrum DSM 15624]
MACGTLTDTYVAAIQHGLVDLPADATRIGVVRQPTSWFHAAVDENLPELGPPEPLLESVRDAEEDMKMQGLCEEGAHNAAWDRVGFGDAYRDHLESDDSARAAVETLSERLAAGESLALVCYENTEKKRCHRTILREYLEQ